MRNIDSKCDGTSYSERMKKHFRSSRFHWSMAFVKSLSESEANEINSNVSQFCNTLHKWKKKGKANEQEEL